MFIKNIAEGGRGLGVKGHGSISFAPGEVKEVPDAVIKIAKLDPTNAAMLTEAGGLVEVGGNPNASGGSPALANPSGSPEDVAKIEAAAAKARAESEARAAEAQRLADEDAAVKAAAEEQAAKDKAAADAAKVETPVAPAAKAEPKKGASK